MSESRGGPGPAGPVVVGVDGSEASSAALAWAAEEARLRGTALRVLRAWQVPALAYGAWVLPPDSLADWEASVGSELEDQVSAVLGDRAGLEVVAEARQGPAARVLVEASASASLLVVGSRGGGGFSALLLGSVSLQVAHHASCPVVIVRRG
jgi:nucleotide-binding universal stress UspA family protein